METLLLIFQFLPILVDLAEKLFVGDKTGPQKKTAVLNALPAIAKNIEAVSTGGQKDTWKVINENLPTLSRAVDVTASIMFPSDEHDSMGS